MHPFDAEVAMFLLIDFVGAQGGPARRRHRDEPGRTELRKRISILSRRAADQKSMSLRSMGKFTASKPPTASNLRLSTAKQAAVTAETSWGTHSRPKYPG